jgi:NagD protein
MVGDRIYTDVQMAFNAGAFGVLVLSGETTLEIEAEAPRKPDLTAQNIAVLGELLRKSRE